MAKDYGVWVAGLLAVSVMAGCGFGGKTEPAAESGESGKEISQAGSGKSGNKYPDNYTDGCVMHAMMTVEAQLDAEGIRNQVSPAQITRAKEASQIICECVTEKLEESLPYERALAADKATVEGREANQEDIAIIQKAATDCQKERLPANFFD